MNATSLRAFRLLVLLALIGGCAEGGVSGTGISAVSGNVVQVSDDAALAALPFPIRVTVEQLPSASAVTDAAGAFTLRGAFSGAITLQFSNAADGAAIGPLALEVPAGSSTVLENIEIRLAAPPADRVRPRAIRQLDVFGRLDMADCGADGSGTLLVIDDGRPPRQFLARLTTETVIARPDGTLLTCADLQDGRHPPVLVEGLLRDADRTIVATRVTVGPRRPPPPDDGMPRPERLRGVATAVACARGIIEMTQLVDAERVRRTIRLDGDTEVRCGVSPSRACSCGDIAPGDTLQVGGILRPADPGLVHAETVTVLGRLP
jgi:hypothetical protein